jgi:hypothetical protein
MTPWGDKKFKAFETRGCKGGLNAKIKGAKTSENLVYSWLLELQPGRFSPPSKNNLFFLSFLSR